MRKHRFLKAFAGFTIIELLVVMVILAIASSIAVPMIINNTNDKKKETYRQSCISVFEEATNIAETYNKGPAAYNISGVCIDPSKAEGGIKGVETLLNSENIMSYKFEVDVVSSATNPNYSYSKDTVVVYFAYSTDKTQALAVGCWYMVNGNKTPQYKYDYSEGYIAVSTAFTAPVYS